MPRTQNRRGKIQILGSRSSGLVMRDENGPEVGWNGNGVVAEATVLIPDNIAQDLSVHAGSGQNQRRQVEGVPPNLSAEWRSIVSLIRKRLDGWPGFVIITGFPIGPDHDVDYPRRLVWRFGQYLGQPVTQDTLGTSIYEVVDTGASTEAGARLSVTNKRTGFHTDNSFEKDVPRYVALYCVEAAESGGRSQLISAHTIVERLCKIAPDVVERLKLPVFFDRRGGIEHGEEPYASYPVIDSVEGRLVVRYLRYYIESGYAKAGQRMDVETRIALDTFDEACAHPGLAADFSLSRGDMLIVDNYCVLHNRTQFHDDRTRQRRLLRLWLRPHDEPGADSSAGVGH